MDSFDTSAPESQDSNQSNEPPIEEELSHSDKLIGIFTEPGKTFESMAKFPPRTVDWVVPVIVMLLIVIVAQFLMMSNNEIYYQIKQKQMARVEKNLNEMVKKNQLSPEKAKEQMDKIEENMEKGRSTIGKVFQGLGILIFGFIVFFIVSGVYFLFARFVFKGDGNYASVLVANGMTAYIAIIQVILAAIFALALGKLMNDISLASFLGTDKSTFLGFLFEKINPITIWAYIVLSIGLAKMFKASSTAKYYVMVFGLWIVWGLIVFVLGKTVPILKFLAG